MTLQPHQQEQLGNLLGSIAFVATALTMEEPEDGDKAQLLADKFVKRALRILAHSKEPPKDYEEARQLFAGFLRVVLTYMEDNYAARR